jgi:hypothetical protein
VDKFIAIDGEGHGNELVLLAANTADGKGETYVEHYGEGGLSTEEMMEWLWGLKDMYPEHKFIGFSFNYDVNMILNPVLSQRKPMVKRLVERKKLTIRLNDTTSLYIVYIPSKMVTFKEAFSTPGKKSTYGRSITIEDTFGFYQQSFVKALVKWDMSDKEALARIEEGKKHRPSEFAEMNPEQVRTYCFTECQQLAQLTDKLAHAIDSAGIKLNKYIGAGAIAQTFMNKYRVDNHVTHDNAYGKDIQDSIMHAYFGGRSEVFRQGYFRDGVSVYDINSAYPSETLHLPSLRNASWRSYTGTNRTLQEAINEIPYGMAYLSWDMGTSMPFMVPFPRRTHNGNIRYRGKGTGWYWLSEVKAALRYFPDKITIHRISALEVRDGGRPFGFVEHLARMRLQAKANGLPTHQIYKLGLNSLYGKTAQAKRGNRYPAYQSYVWAGMITAGTRAKLLDVIVPNQDKVIACATDGVIFTGDIECQCGDGLGEWEHKTYDELLYLQAGIYFIDGFGIRKTRGHILADLHYENIKNGWLQEGPNFEYKYTSRRFIGMGLANHLNDFSRWCQWVDFPRTLRCKVAGKMIDNPGHVRYLDGWEIEHTDESYRLVNMMDIGRHGTHSYPYEKYEIKESTSRINLDEFIAKEQPSIPTLF